MTNFAAIDFETATDSRDSACAIGAVVVEDGNVVAKKALLIQPPGNRYDSFNTSIHGITPADTRSAGTFEQVWPEVAEMIAGLTVVAHNAPFDMSVLRHSAARQRYVPPSTNFACSCRLAKDTWPERWSYRLSALADDFGIALRHHDPLSDANAAAEIALTVMGHHSAQSIDEVAEKLGYRLGEVSGTEYKPFSNAKISRGPRNNRAKLSAITAEVDDFDEEHPMFGCTIAFTGKLVSMTRAEAAQKSVNFGARATSNISQTLRFLVVGETDLRQVGSDGMSNKLRRALELAESGLPLEIIGEEEFLEMVSL